MDAVSLPQYKPGFSVGRQARLQPHHRSLADDAIHHMRELNASAPDKPFFLYYVPGGSHSPHQPTQEWIDKFHGKFDMGWEKLRDEIFANQKRLGVIPPENFSSRDGLMVKTLTAVPSCRDGIRSDPEDALRS